MFPRKIQLKFVRVQYGLCRLYIECARETASKKKKKKTIKKGVEKGKDKRKHTFMHFPWTRI